MQVRTNREFKELIEKVYDQKFDNKNYIKKPKINNFRLFYNS